MKLTLQQQAKLQRFLVAMQDKELLPGDAFWVNQLLEKCAEARVLYIQSVHIGSHLNWDFGITPGDADYPEEKLILGEPPNPELLKSSSIKRPKKRRKKAKEVSFYSSQKTKIALLVIAPLLLLGFFWGGFHLVQATFFNNGIATKNDMLQIGKMRELTEGELELSFPTGSQVVLIAPVKFVVTGENSIRLLSGKLVANVPTSGIGFTVDTPRGRVVDLGTIFSVHATKELDTIVQVFRGKVIASFVDDKGLIHPTIQIEENHAVNIDFLKEGLVDIPYASNDFDTNIQKEFGIVNHSKSVVFQEKAMPTSVAVRRHKDFGHDHLAFLFLEKRNVLLEQELEVYSNKVSGEQESKQYSYQKTIVPVGTKVDSFFIFYNPEDNKNLSNPVQGVIQFDRPVLGIIVSKKAFLESDQLFRSPEEDGSNIILERSASNIDVNKEILKSSLGQDYVILSEDRKKLTFRLVITKAGTDEFRVIVKSQDVPKH